MSDLRGLHPATRTQRRGREGDWARADGGSQVELRDVPAPAVAKGLAATVAGLIAIVIAVVAVARLVPPAPALGPRAAHARFATAGPPLLAQPGDALHDAQAAHPAPRGASLATAIARVAASGWGDEDRSAPGPARVAMDRAEEGR